MQLKFNLFQIIAILIIILSYLGNIFSQFTLLCDFGIALGVIAIYIYWSLNNEIRFSKRVIWIEYLVLLLIGITFRPSLISLILLIILSIIVKNNKIDIKFF